VSKEHSSYVEPAGGFGPMMGFRWHCTCGRSGKPVYRREQAQKGADAHITRMARKAAAT
jgi:hypothetical protein